jgi:hypothetical protein
LRRGPSRYLRERRRRLAPPQHVIQVLGHPRTFAEVIRAKRAAHSILAGLSDVEAREAERLHRRGGGPGAGEDCARSAPSLPPSLARAHPRGRRLARAFEREDPAPGREGRPRRGGGGSLARQPPGNLGSPDSPRISADCDYALFRPSAPLYARPITSDSQRSQGLEERRRRIALALTLWGQSFMRYLNM